MQSDAARPAEEKTLCLVFCEMTGAITSHQPRQTYTGINWFVALHFAVLAQPVVSLAKGDAWQAVCYEAQVDGAAAAKQGVVPCLGGRGRGTLYVLRGLGEHGVEALLPVLDIVVVDGAGGGWLGRGLGVSRCCHFQCTCVIAGDSRCLSELCSIRA